MQQSLHRPRPCSASASASGSATQRMAHLRLSPAIGRPFALRMPACAGAALQSGSRRTARTSTRAVDATFESSAAAGVVDEAVAVVSSVLEEAKLSYNKQYDRIFGPGSHEEIDTKKALPKPDRGAQALEQGAKKVLLSDVHAIPRRPMLERQWTVTDFAYAGFLGGMHLLACLAPFTFSLPMLGLFFGMYFITGCLGITLSYHRQLSHRSFTTPKWLEYALAYCGVLAAQGDPIEWVSGHRYHHLHTDTVLDPHSPYEGFWWSHVGWLLDNDVMLARVGNRANAAELSFLWAPPWLPAIKLAYQSKPTQYLLTSSQDNDVTLARVGNRSNAADLSSQWFYRWLQATWPWHVVLQFAALFALGGLPALVWGGALRMVWVYHVTWFVNSASHCWGNQQYNTGDLSRNNWWVGLLAFGEGWHNNHHAFEFSARHGLEWWQLDVTWMIIRALQAVGLATNVKLPTERQKNRMRVRPTKAAPAAAAAAAEQQQP